MKIGFAMPYEYVEQDYAMTKLIVVLEVAVDLEEHPANSNMQTAGVAAKVERVLLCSTMTETTAYRGSNKRFVDHFMQFYKDEALKIALQE